jgi:hypothetical protein
MLYIRLHIYYPETKEQKAYYEEIIDEENEEEIEEEAREAFDIQEREKERIWNEKGQRWPSRRASWESFWKRFQHKRNERSRGGVDHMRYMYEVIEPFLILFYNEITL